MRARTALLLLILAALAIFTALNWTVITTPTQIHLVFARIDAPLGVILLLVTAGVTLLYGVFLTWIETAAMLETRRFARELQAQRQLAETAEASRYTELKAYLQGEMASLRTFAEGMSKDAIERAGNTLNANFAELEERLDRGERPTPPRTIP